MQCPTCDKEILAGTRWCPLCNANVLDPTVGRLASPFKRLAAYVLEAVILAVVFWLSIMAIVAGDAGAVTVLGFFLAAAYAALALGLFAQGTSPGKKVLGMRVVKEDGTAANWPTMFIREVVGKQISLLFLSLGFLWILFDSHKQGWHDKLVSTYVVD